MIVKLTFTDWFTKKTSKQVISPNDPLTAIAVHSKKNPDAMILAEWVLPTGKPKFSKCEPYNMRLDQMRMEEEEMSFDEFQSKWYGKLKRSQKKAIMKEIIETIEQETENGDSLNS